MTTQTWSLRRAQAPGSPSGGTGTPSWSVSDAMLPTFPVSSGDRLLPRWALSPVRAVTKSSLRSGASNSARVRVSTRWPRSSRRPHRLSRRHGVRDVKSGADPPLPAGSVRKGRTPLPKSRLVSEQMSRMPRSSTGPEVALRRALHAAGLRFRVHLRELPGTPDIAFTRAKVAVFVDGCFWHGCAQHGVLPKNNREWWREKLGRNRDREQREGR